MYPNLYDLQEVKHNLPYIIGNCVDKARDALYQLHVEFGWPLNRLTMVNCKTEKEEYHRVLIINHRGWQYVIDDRLPTVMLLDDVPYTDWYGGKELT